MQQLTLHLEDGDLTVAVDAPGARTEADLLAIVRAASYANDRTCAGTWRRIKGNILRHPAYDPATVRVLRKIVPRA